MPKENPNPEMIKSFRQLIQLEDEKILKRREQLFDEHDDEEVLKKTNLELPSLEEVSVQRPSILVF